MRFPELRFTDSALYQPSYHVAQGGPRHGAKRPKNTTFVILLQAAQGGPGHDTKVPTDYVLASW